jgi:hypothetical protein
MVFLLREPQNERERRSERCGEGDGEAGSVLLVAPNGGDGWGDTHRGDGWGDRHRDVEHGDGFVDAESGSDDSLCDAGKESMVGAA